MRWRSTHATLTAVALILATAVVARAQDIDAFGDLAAPALAKVPVDKTPTGSLGHPGLKPEPIRAIPTSDVAVVARKAVDSEIDSITKPATPAPSNDPLDAAGTAKPDAAKPDATKPAAADDAKKREPATPPKTEGKAAETGASAVSSATSLPSANAAIKALLDKRAAADLRGAQAVERRKQRAAIEAYYEAHDYAPTWSDDGVPVAAVASVLARLAKASDDALMIPTPPPQLIAKGTPDEIAASDVALTESVVAYARQASGARVDPVSISPLIGARPELADPSLIVDTVASAGAAAGADLVALNPREPRYAALREKLAALRGARAAVVAPIPAGPTLKLGMHDARVPLLRTRFNISASNVAGRADEYDMAIAEAVSSLQRASGLPITGRLDRRAILAMDGGGKDPAQEGLLVANMEMWRWMPRDLGHDRIEVDVPAFKVTVYHEGEAVATHRVVVGKTETPTPIFSNVMKYVIVNPVWNVPQSIIKKEMMSKIDAGGLRGFDVSYRNGQVVVKQPSGAKNALGQIKFMFPNDFSVYLHDTPSKSLFASSRRAFSHGCVRVDQPFDFAFSVLNDGVPEGGKILWSEKRLASLVGDKERYVNLPKPLPIHIEYFTASVDMESGRLVLREDIYGYAREVARALGVESGPAYLAERKPRRTMAKAAVARATVAVDSEDPR